MSTKFYVLLGLSIIMGFAFMAIGFYFLSQRFLNKLNEAMPVQDVITLKHNSFKAKGSGYVAMSLGAITLVFALFMFFLPELVSLLVLIYMIILVIAFVILTFAFK